MQAVIGWMAGVALTLGATGMAQAQMGSGGDQGPPTVVVIETAFSDVTPSFSQVGRAEAFASVELRARVEGFLQEQNFREGGNVTTETPLFVIEPDTYTITVERRQAELEGAEATQRNAQLTYNRRLELRERGSGTQADVDAALASLETARASVSQARAALRAAELDLAYTEIRSPIDGVISEARYDVGNLVTPQSEPLATVVSIDPIYVTIEISDRDLIVSRRQGIDLDNPPVAPRLRLADGTVYPLEGQFDYLAPSVNPNTDTVTARALFDNPDRLLVPGQLLTVVVSAIEPMQRIRIPQVAVQEDRDGYYVLVVGGDNIARVRRIQVFDQIEDDWIVLDGLDADERVIVRGLQRVRQGVAVNPVIEGGI